MSGDFMRVLEAAFPGEGARYFHPMKIGRDDPAIADEGAAAILDGIQTTTSSPFWDYPDGRIPFVGALGLTEWPLLELHLAEPLPLRCVVRPFCHY